MGRAIAGMLYVAEFESRHLMNVVPTHEDGLNVKNIIDFGENPAIFFSGNIPREGVKSWLKSNNITLYFFAQ